MITPEEITRPVEAVVPCPLPSAEPVPQPSVYLVEDNEAVREALVAMLNSQGIAVHSFRKPSEMLACYQPEFRGCLIFDYHLPEMNALELQDHLAKAGCRMPFIIISGKGEVAEAILAMKRGAVDYIEKPFKRELLLSRISQALREDSRRQSRQVKRDAVQTKLDSLTRREREVLDLVVEGLLTKQIARKLNISVKTVEAHRSNIAKKMNVDSSLQLVRIVTEHRIRGRLDDLQAQSTT